MLGGHAHTQLDTHSHTCIHTHAHIHAHICTHTDTRVHTHILTLTCIHPYLHIYTHIALKCSHTCIKYTHIHTLICSCTHIHTYIHTLPLSLSLSLSLPPPILLSPLLSLHSPSLPVPISELRAHTHTRTHTLSRRLSRPLPLSPWVTDSHCGGCAELSIRGEEANSEWGGPARGRGEGVGSLPPPTWHTSPGTGAPSRPLIPQGSGIQVLACPWMVLHSNYLVLVRRKPRLREGRAPAKGHTAFGGQSRS